METRLFSLGKRRVNLNSNLPVLIGRYREDRNRFFTEVFGGKIRNTG